MEHGIVFKPAPEISQIRPFEALITSMGTAAFSDAMLRCLNTISHIDHFSIVSLGTKSTAELVSSASLPGDQTTPSAQNAYIDQYHQVDPNRRLLSRFNDSLHPAGPTYSVQHLERDQIHNSGYRNDCYVRPGLLDRYSVIQLAKTQIHCLNLYRYTNSGHFCGRDFAKLAHYASLLATFTSKHCALVGAAQTSETRSGSLEQVAQRLRATNIKLSRRELDVAARILFGYSSEAIALELGISRNTVLTYRKRIYTKAGISSQNDLFALCLGQTQH